MTDSTRKCAGCGKPISLWRVAHRATFCTNECRNDVYKTRYFGDRSTSRFAGLPTGAIGAVHEMVVSVDLMRRGYDVFRALSPSGACDLVAFRGDDLLRVEVKTATRNHKGAVAFGGKARTLARGTYDVLAFVFHSGEIVYEPPLGGESQCEETA